MEKQNKTVRQKRKKEETTRIRTLVGRCGLCNAQVHQPLALPCRHCVLSGPEDQEVQGGRASRERGSQEGKGRGCETGGRGERTSRNSIHSLSLCVM